MHESRNVQKPDVVFQKTFHGHFVGSVEFSCFSPGQCPAGKVKAGKCLCVRRFKGERAAFQQIQGGNSCIFQHERPGKAGGNGQAHVGRGQLGHDRSVFQLDKGVNYGLRMHCRCYSVHRHIVEVAGFDDLQPLVHERGGINGDFRTHAPVRMSEGMLGAHGAQFLPCFAAERAAGRSEDKRTDFLRSAACHALEQGIVFGVHRQDHRAGAGTD